jgi:hypothetical protein
METVCQIFYLMSRDNYLDVLLKTKAQLQFDRAVTERSKLFFRVFSGQIGLNFGLVFDFTVRSAEGRSL